VQPPLSHEIRDLEQRSVAVRCIHPSRRCAAQVGKAFGKGSGVEIIDVAVAAAP